MEGNTAANMIPGASYGFLDLQQGSMHVQHQQRTHLVQQQQESMVQPPMHDVFPLTKGNMNESEQPVSAVGERAKTLTNNEDEPSYTEGGGDTRDDAGRRKNRPSTWQRMKWNDMMVRLLINIISYLDDYIGLECNTRRRMKMAMQKKGKWKAVSKVLAERGYHVASQQCEDKFNDLNKRYRTLTDILGRGNSCKVVENPTLLDMMDHLSDKSKEAVRKILSSKHLFYQEMCSYHNGNRLHLPPDPSLQRSLQLALISGEDDEMHDTRRHQPNEEDDQDDDSDDHHDDPEEIHAFQGDNGVMFGHQGGSAKRMKHGNEHEDLSFCNSSTEHGSKGSFLQPPNSLVNVNQVILEDNKADWMQKQLIKPCSLQLKEDILQIQAKIFVLEEQRSKWEIYKMKKDRELDELKMEYEREKLEKKRMALEWERKEMETGNN